MKYMSLSARVQAFKVQGCLVHGLGISFFRFDPQFDLACVKLTQVFFGFYRCDDLDLDL